MVVISVVGVSAKKSAAQVCSWEVPRFLKALHTHKQTPHRYNPAEKEKEREWVWRREKQTEWHLM